MPLLVKARRLLILLFAENWLTAVVGVVSMVILARIVGPEVFGILALGGAVLGSVSMFVGGTLTESLLQRDQVEAGHFDIIFWVNSALCGGFALIFALLAPVFASVFNAPQLTEVLPWMALTTFIGSLNSVPETLLERTLDQDRLLIVDNIIDLATTALCIGLAVAGFGIWSFVISMLLAAIVGTSATFYFAKWMPGMSGTWAHFKDLYKFNRATLIMNLLGYIDSMVPTLALGYVFGERTVGIYSMAMNIVSQISGALMGPFGELAMTVTARLQSDLSRVRDVLDRVYSITTFILYPATIGAILTLPLAIPLLLDPDWMELVVPTQIAMLMCLRHATGDFNIDILRGVDDTNAPILILCVGVAVLLVLLPAAMPYGAIGVAVAVTARLFLTWPLAAWKVSQRTGYPVWRQFTQGWRAFIASMVMGASILALQILLTPHLAGAALLISLVTAGVIIFIGVYMALWPKHLVEGKRALTNLDWAATLTDSARDIDQPTEHKAIP